MGCNASADAHETTALSGSLVQYPNPNGKKTVVIVGGGIAGISAAEGIWDHANVVLIDQKDHFEYNPFIVKVAQDEKIPETLFATFEETIKGYNNKFQFVQGKLLNVLKENTIEIQNPVTKSRSHIKYDALVIATGFLYNNPIKNDNAYSVTERKGAMQKFNKQVADAKTILILGGGIVGVELAGEIAFHPDAANKKITLAVRGQRLLNQLPEDAHKAADSFLKTKNVEIQYNVTDFSALKKKFDLVLECFGQTYKADFLKKTFPSAIAQNGQIYVNNQLQIVDKAQGAPLADKIFALGDCSLTPLKEVKNIPSLKFLSFTLEKNLQALVKGEAVSTAIPKTLPVFAAVSIGPAYGMFVMNSNVIVGDENGKAKYDFASTWVKVFKGDFEAFNGNKGYLAKTLADLSA